MKNELRKFRAHFRHEILQWNYELRKRRDRKRYFSWIDRLNRELPEVFLGPDLPYGGVRGHVRAIKKYSRMKVQLVPDEVVMGSLARFTGEVREHFMNYNPRGQPVVHSHVVPWMIQWCQNQQKRGLLWVHTYHLPYFPEHAIGDLRDDQKEINHVLIHQAKYADVRLSVSRWQQDYLSAEYGIETVYIPNGVDVRSCDHGREDRFRERTGVKGPFVLYVGRNDPVKNPSEFILLAHSKPELQFVMMGQSLDERSMSRDWGLTSPTNLHYAGSGAHREVQDALAACSLLVVTSKREGLPTLVMEGMTQKKPIVVPNEKGCMEVTGEGDCGYIYELGNLGDLAEKVDLAREASKIGERGRARVLEQYDWKVVAPQLDAIYQRS